MKGKLQSWNIAEEGIKQRSKRKPPVAPTKAEYDFYDRYIKKVSKETKNRNSFILGATPELLDIALENNFVAYCLDLSKKIIDFCNSIMKYKDSPNKKLKQGNWIDMNFKNDFFSIVLGDAPFINMSTKEHNEELFNILNKQIMPKEYLVIRHLALPNLKPIPKSKLVSLYRQRKITFPDFFMELRIIIYQDKVYNKRTYQYDSKRNFDLIEEDYKKNIFNKKERDKLMAYRTNVINTFIPEKIFLKMAEKQGFNIIEIFQDNKFRFQNYLRMYAFQKR